MNLRIDWEFRDAEIGNRSLETSTAYTLSVPRTREGEGVHFEVMS